MSGGLKRAEWSQPRQGGVKTRQGLVTSVRRISIWVCHGHMWAHTAGSHVGLALLGPRLFEHRPRQRVPVDGTVVQGGRGAVDVQFSAW